MTLGAALLPAFAQAHPHHDHAGGGFATGLAHPLLGLDHVLAMVAVGLWAALAGGRALWAGPLVFLGAMLLAGLAGAGQPAFAMAEHVIVASVIITGLAVALAMPLASALTMVAVFGLAHGYAHGVEGPGGGAYATGFMLATAALHGAGLALARLGPVAVRMIGGGVALGGAALAVI
ncbi:HupE/UreJ family protein [Alkalilacustris brevis]|uniref:HupE/UreJ family protein n=1 Tax=Alkalilacustris brevis TaxID=2026338 RepID=UPI001EE40F5A|nr:HupE/UreJ family protein [Alkalilacustris brevis]